MGFSLVSNVGVNGATTGAIDTAGANLIVACVAFFDGTGSISDSKGNTWTGLTQQGSSGRCVQLFYCAPPTVGSGHTFSTTSGFPSLTVTAWSGVDTSTPLDAQSGSIGVDNPGSITPAADNGLFVTGLQHSDATSQSIDSGFSISNDIANGGGVGCSMAYFIQTAAASKNPSWSPAGNARAAMAVFFAATGGGGTAAPALFHSYYQNQGWR